MSSSDLSKPCLLECRQGLSVLKSVTYRGKALYSKYAPDKAVKALVEKQTLLDSSVFLLESPALWYGAKELLEKISDTSIVCAFEADRELFAFSKDILKEKDFADKIHFFSPDSLDAFDAFLRKEVEEKSLKRIIPLDFSAGVNFERPLYQKVNLACQEIVERFWKNRITLQKFGRLYSKNFFLNLPKLIYSDELKNLAGSVKKNIILFGAGESLEKIFSFEKKDDLIKKINSDFFVIAVDAALPALFDMGIKVDAAVLMEGQAAITKAFIGSKNKIPFLIQDMCSRPDIAALINARPLLYLSKYAKASFLESAVEELSFTSIFPPLGSVGLMALEAALLLKESSKKIFIFGLDFSYSLGKTHANGCPAHKNQLLKTNRLCPLENYDASFSSLCINDKGENKIYTNQALLSYAKLSASYGKNEKYKNEIFEIEGFSLQKGFAAFSLDDLMNVEEGVVSKEVACLSKDGVVTKETAGPSKDAGTFTNAGPSKDGALFAKEITWPSKDGALFTKEITCPSKDAGTFTNAGPSKDGAMFTKEVVCSSKDCAMFTKEAVCSSKEGAMFTKEVVCSSKDCAMFTKEAVCSSKEGAMFTKEVVCSSKDCAMFTKEAVCSSKEGALFTKEITCPPKDAGTFTNAGPSKDGAMFTKEVTWPSKDGALFTKEATCPPKDCAMFTKEITCSTKDAASFTNAGPSKDGALFTKEITPSTKDAATFTNTGPSKEPHPFFLKEKTKSYLENEVAALKIARDLLSKGKDSAFFNKEVSLESQIENLLSKREYLFLHFPDGNKFKNEKSFLKRIRAELDYFIKIQNLALSFIE